MNNTASNSSSPLGQDLAYDLRQSYAKIVGEHMQDVADARKSDSFYAYYKNLEDLYTIVRHKFKDIKKGEEEYRAKVKAFVIIANQYKDVWTGVSKDPTGHGAIDASLRQIEMFLYEKMNEAKMFGQSGHIAGL